MKTDYKYLIGGSVVLSSAMSLQNSETTNVLTTTLGIALIFFGVFKIYQRANFKTALIGASVALLIPAALFYLNFSTFSDNKETAYSLSGNFKHPTKNGDIQGNVNITNENVLVKLDNQGIFIDSINIKVLDYVLNEKNCDIKCIYNDDDKMTHCSTDSHFFKNKAEFINSFNKIRVSFSHNLYLESAKKVELNLFSRRHSLKLTCQLNNLANRL